MYAENVLVVAPGSVIAQFGAGVQVVAGGDHRKQQQRDADKSGNYHRQSASLHASAPAAGGRQDDPNNRQQPHDIEQVFQAVDEMIPKASSACRDWGSPNRLAPGHRGPAGLKPIHFFVFRHD